MTSRRKSDLYEMLSNYDGSRSRRETVGIIIVIVGTALVVGVWAARANASYAQERSKLSAYLRSHQCVVAEMQGRFVQSYRCDQPAPSRYVSVKDLRRAALSDGPASP